MKWTNWGWLGSIALAFVIGRNTVKPKSKIETVEVEAPSCAIPAHDRPTLAARWQPRANASRVDGAPKRSAPKKFELGEPRALDEASRALMAYAEQKLKEGPEGHLELLETIDRELVEKRQAWNGLADPSDVSRQLYPWLRFMMEHDAEITEMTETVFATMASDPQRFADLEPDTLEIFTEGMALFLPGAAPEETLDRMRTYAETIVEMHPDTIPHSIQAQQGDIERSLEAWAPPIPREELLQRLSSGLETSRESTRLLRRMNAEQVAGLDPLDVFGKQLDRGDLGAAHYLHLFQLDPNTVAALDDRLLFGSGAELVPNAIFTYLEQTGRARPDQQEDFWERAQRSPHADRIAAARNGSIIY